MKPPKPHILRREGETYVFTNQAGQEVRIDGLTTIDEIARRGITVRLHRITGEPIAPGTFQYQPLRGAIAGHPPIIGIVRRTDSGGSDERPGAIPFQATDP